MNSDKSATRSGLARRNLIVFVFVFVFFCFVFVVFFVMSHLLLFGRNLIVLDLKMPRWALSASVRWTKTILSASGSTNWKCHESHVSGIGAILISNAPRLNAVSRNKKLASVRRTDGPTN